MRWDSLLLDGSAEPMGSQLGVQRSLIERRAVTRTVDTPEFQGITFYEVQARSIINKVPAASRLPFSWTINPYRGCSHACTYCFARRTHNYLDLDSGEDFNSKIVVKVNAVELLRKELRAPSWRGEPIAMGTNVDCYQRAEGRYQLMPGIIEALTRTGNPFSILTKGALILRDLELLRRAATVTEVSVSVSVGFVDPRLWRAAESGAPHPKRRLEVCAALGDAGLPCGVLMAPIIPYLSDSLDQLDAAVRQIASAGARSVTPIVLHLRPGAREWFMAWLEQHHSALVPRYQALYGNRSYAPAEYQDRICRQVRELAARHGIGSADRAAHRLPAARTARAPAPRPAPRRTIAEQLVLL